MKRIIAWVLAILLALAPAFSMAEELAADTPVVQEATVEQPVAEQPVIEEPVVEQPVNEEPVVEQPVIEEPVAEQPVNEEPVAEQPVIEEPVAEQPVIEAPVVEQPVNEEPIVEQPVNEEPVAEQPVIEESVAEQPVIEAPVVEQPAIEEPIVEQPVIEEPIVEQPVNEEPVAEQPVNEEPAAEQPVNEEPAAEQPVNEEPVAEQPVIEDAAVLSLTGLSSDRDVYEVGETVSWTLSCENAETIRYRITAADGAVQKEGELAESGEIAFVPTVSGAYSVQATAQRGEQQQSLTADVLVRHGGLALSLQPDTAYAIANETPIAVRAQASGGVLPYQLTIRILADGAAVYENTVTLAQEGAFSIYYQPDRFGVHQVVASVQDLQHQEVPAQASIPVAIGEKENASAWEAFAKSVPLTGDWRKDLIGLAATQVGYTESSRDFILDADGVQHGYTRYGDWYGAPYSEWCAMFISFCLHYAGIPANGVPREAGCGAWRNTLAGMGAFETAASGYTPEAGDLVFFDSAGTGAPNHVGIVEKAGESEIRTIEGNVSKSVARRDYSLSDSSIVGYASMAALMRRAGVLEAEEIPENAESPAEADAGEAEKEEAEEDGETDDETVTVKPVEVQQSRIVVKTSSAMASAQGGVSSVTASAPETGKTVSFTAVTAADDQYLMMYSENGGLVITWQAASSSTANGSNRTWNITYSFVTAGTRTMTFKAGATSTPGGASKSVTFTMRETASSAVESAAAQFNPVAVGTEQVFTVKTGSAAQYLMMCIENGSVFKTWTASGNSTVSGGTRTWTVKYAFGGAGSRTMTFKAGTTTTPEGSGKAVAFTVQNAVAGVTSAKAQLNPVTVGTEQTFTVETNADAQYLMMCIENGSVFKTWTADGNSTVSGGTRTWTVKYAFGGAGTRTMTFKAGTANTPRGSSKAVTFTVESFGVISAKAQLNPVIVGANQTFTVETSADAQYLMMCIENGSVFKTWTAGGNSTVSGGTRIWTVKYAFGGAGTRTMTFKAGTANTPRGSSKAVTFTVESFGVTSAKAQLNPTVVGVEQVFTVETSADAQYLMMCIENGSVFKTWTAGGNSTVSGGTRTWTVKYAFGGSGTRTMTFKAGTANTPQGTGKAVTFTVESFGVNSAKAQVNPIAVGAEQTFIVETSADAQYLMMCIENGSVFKTWTASGNSTVSGGTRTWTVKYAFGGAGSRTMTFKAGTANTPQGVSKAVAFTVENIGVNSVIAQLDPVTVGKEQTFVVETGSGAKYLMMCVENGSVFKTWSADGNSTVSGGTRTWTVTHAFGGAGTRTMTFKAGSTTTPGSNGKAVTFTVAQPIFIVENGVLVGYRGHDTVIVIPSDMGIHTIGEAFKENTSITSVTIPDGVTEIAENAFSNASSLQEIHWPDSIVKIGKRAFYQCTSLGNASIVN